jgi:hypothetical protein
MYAGVCMNTHQIYRCVSDFTHLTQPSEGQNIVKAFVLAFAK